VIDPDRLARLAIPDVVQRYDTRDTILYALALGYGHDPLDPGALPFCYEEGLEAAPTFPTVLAYPGFWIRDLDSGIDHRGVLHGEQVLELHASVPVKGCVISRTRIADIVDKGADALVVVHQSLYDRMTGTLIATMRQTNFCRGEGGFAGKGVGGGPVAEPTGPPLRSVRLSTRPDAALLYRLCGDTNPLHADPQVARAAGFARPILHGMATFGIVGHAIVKAVCGYDPARLSRLSARFSAPLFPGEDVRVDLWQSGTVWRFRAFAVGRDVEIVRCGIAILNK
jgi:acyl dehydratase